MKKLTFILFFILTQTVFAQEVEFTVKPNKTKIGLNEELRVEFIMNVDDNDTFRAPNFEGFKLKSETPAQRISQKYVNGVRSYEKTYTYVLEPTEKGTFYIESAIISKNWEKHKTEPLQIEVIDSVKNPNKPNIEEIYSFAEANRKEIYEGEVFSIDYKLLTDNEVGRVEVVNIDSLTYIKAGFSFFKDLEKNIKGQEKYKGKDYEKIEFYRIYYSPKKIGDLTFPSLEFKVDLLFPNGSKNMWGGSRFDTITKKIKTNPIKMKVSKLPQNGKNEFFNGVIGNYTLTQNLNVKPNLKVGETFDIEIIIEGMGNQAILPMPKLSFSEGLEIVEIKEEKPLTYYNKPDFILKTTYTIKPKYAGEHYINKLTYSYFDPVKKEYIYDVKNEQIITVIE